MHLAGQQWQVLAETHAGNAGGDATKGSPDLRGRVGLHVPGVEVAWTAVEEQQNGVVRLGGDGAPIGGPQQVWPGQQTIQAKPTECTQPDQTAPRQGVKR